MYWNSTLVVAKSDTNATLYYLEITIPYIRILMMLTIFFMDHDKGQARAAFALYYLYVLCLCVITLWLIIKIISREKGSLSASFNRKHIQKCEYLWWH